MQSPLKAGLYICKRIIFLSLRLWDFIAHFVGERNAENLAKNEHIQCVTSATVRVRNYSSINLLSEGYKI